MQGICAKCGAILEAQRSELTCDTKGDLHAHCSECEAPVDFKEVIEHITQKRL